MTSQSANTRIGAAFIATCMCCASASAQFTTSAATPDVLATGNNDQVQSKVVNIPSGGFYMSWYDNSAGGYDPWVQRYDANGIGLWPNKGVRVLDTNFSSTEDYGLTSDAAGNAVVVTRSDIGSLKIIAQAVSPSGVLLWGANGVTLSTTNSVNAPKAGRAGDGAAVAGWTEGSRAKVMRLTPEGTPAWASVATISDGTATTFLSDLQPGDGGTVIASIVRYQTFSGAKTLQAQKFSSTGVAQWVSTNVRVFTTGSLQYGNFPPFIADGEGGAIFAWYGTGPLQSYAQWVSPTGDLRFGPNGSGVTATTTLERVSPTAAYDPVLRRIYVAWNEHVPNSSMYGSGGQSFSEAGTRLWGEAGLTFSPTDTTYEETQARVAMLGEFPTFSSVRSPAYGSQMSRAYSYDSIGTPRWAAPVELTPVGFVGRMVFMPTSGSPAGVLAIWESGAVGVTDLVGTRLNADGTLGLPSVCGDLNGDGAVTGADLGLLLGAWGPANGSPFDLNHDGVVNGADLGILLGCWTA
ncbi:MAG: hypothetical protein NT059_07160 [Planctomycetota bacterium]|nr:hypothetical protein [Planctomycetota bacterium]